VRDALEIRLRHGVVAALVALASFVACGEPASVRVPIASHEPSPANAHPGEAALADPDGAALAPARSESHDVAGAPPETPAAPELDSLRTLRVLGPEPALTEVCGPSCKLSRKLATTPPAVLVAIAEGTDPLDSQPPAVVTTSIVFQLADGWYGAAIFRRGAGVAHLEIFNPPGFSQAMSLEDEPRRYTGALTKVASKLDAGLNQSLTVLELRRGDGLEEDSVVVCGIDAGQPQCRELAHATDAIVRGYDLDGGVMSVRWASGETDRFRAFP